MTIGNFIDVSNAVYLIPIVDEVPGCIVITFVGVNFISKL